ncbi:glycoside hydrolase family 43 protein [Deinococcus roseus]|uniref:Xylan 1,4-beta-xylosidase n=1 Tax=Deinococcus roseus TaxID=392414 RepID=A0ABQ2D1Z5_9DEIO|nr:glycoside hydrolase family 43 protein [Deinococcus roseus]GGJ42342.1 xylan 1,4-beta-xylosidase [Deinococcus roseus]
MPHLHNPILKGFNPDPSILRVGEDYYIATSTFEWFPGVQIHHSRDLVNWRLLTRPLNRLSQLDMRGNTDSAGIWAPCLTHDGEKFFLIYTDVKHWKPDSPFKDTHNYLVTAENIEGPWSEPIHLNSSGFDPSLFHDDDGKKWLLNMRWDHRQGNHPFSGIVLQEYDAKRQKLVGDIHTIFYGTSLQVTEGPHIYKKDGWYYLLTAEGGTTYEHAVTFARSRSLFGPYEVHPENPLLTSFGKPELALQKAGHGSLVDTPTGDWYLAHLAGRPLEGPEAPSRHCNLGRETSLQPVRWDADGWPRVPHGNHPELTVEVNLPAHPWPAEPVRDEFDTETLSIHWQSMRVPMEENWVSLHARPGHLRLIGRESPVSAHQQSLIGRRLQAHHARARTVLEFQPHNFQQMAGLSAYYNTSNWVFLHLTHDDVLGRHLRLGQCENGKYSEWTETLPVQQVPIHLGVTFQGEHFGFEVSLNGQDWQPFGPQYDSWKLSDEHCGGLSFTGTFVALSAHDMSGQGCPADFDHFEYQEFDGETNLQQTLLEVEA